MSTKKIQMQHTRAHGKADIFESPPQSPDAPPTGKKNSSERDGQKVLFVRLELKDWNWLNREMERYRRDTKRRITKLEVVQMGLELIRKAGGIAEASKITS